MAGKPRQRLPFQIGRFRVVERLGGGSQGEVFLAYLEGPLGFRLKVALKIVEARPGQPDRLVKAIANEARTLAAARHPNVVQVHDFFRLKDQYLLALEYVDGLDLTGVMAPFRARGQGLPLPVALQIGEQIALALNCVHTLQDHAGNPAPMIHRDLKPANVLVSEHGLVKVADFGLAKGNLIAFHTTATDITRGTPGYMSPEQVRGHELTPASDRFSFATVLFEMLTGQVLFSDDSAQQIMMRVMKVEPSADLGRVYAISPEVGHIVEHCLNKDPERRYRETAELVHELQTARSALGVQADLTSLVELARQAAAGAPEDRVTQSTQDFFFSGDG